MSNDTRNATTAMIERLIRSVGAKSSIVTGYSVDATFTMEMRESAEHLARLLRSCGVPDVETHVDRDEVIVNGTLVAA